MVVAKPVVDLTSLSATSGGGVSRMAVGVVAAMGVLGAAPSCLVGAGTREEWIALLPSADIEEVVVRLDAGSRWQTALRSKLPAGLKTSRVVGVVRRVRSRAVRAAGRRNVIWYPFHRSLATAANSVVTVHDLRVFEPEFASAMDQRIVARNVRRASALVCSWPHPYEALIERFPDARNKTFQIPLPVLNAGPPRNRPRVPGSTVTLLYPAYVTEHKDHETLIRALVQLPEAVLICTGAETAHARAMRALADDLEVSARIDWRGYVEQPELDGAYSEADILVMPSLWEAASGPVLEAVVRRIPFVASDIPPLASQVHALGLPASDWLFAARDPDSLARTVRTTVDAYADRVRALAEPGRAVAARTWQSTAEEYLAVFAWVAGDRDRPTFLQGARR